jgi:zinc/manganese transport system substrate-binding protein
MKAQQKSAGVFLVIAMVATACGLSVGGGNSAGVPVVAAENSYGDVAQQIGGSYVQVTSVLSDPNVDPHEYESNARDAKAVAQARLVIHNGAGYDPVMDKLLAG